MSGRARGGAFHEVGATGSAPLSVPEHPPRFPDPPVRRTGNTVERPISAHPPLSEGLGGRGKWEGPFGTASDGNGSAHRRTERWRTAGGAGVTNPTSKPSGIGENADAAKIDLVGGPSTTRRVDLSEGGPSESVPHRARRRWGAAGNRAPPILELAEAAMALAEERRECGESAEGTPLRR